MEPDSSKQKTWYTHENPAGIHVFTSGAAGLEVMK